MPEQTTAPPFADWRARMRRSMMPVLIGLTAALLALALAIGQTILAQREARSRAMNEGDMLLALNAVMSALLNGETGQRGYLLTGKPDYLSPYLSAKQRLRTGLARLHEVADRMGDPAGGRDADRLSELTDAKFIEMDRSIALARAGFQDQARTIVQSDLGKFQMDAIRSEIGRQMQDKASKRRNAFASAEALERRLLPLIGVLGVAIVALIVAGFRTERKRAQSAAEAAQAAVLREAHERTALLARELNHRVKNLFSVILAIVTLSGRKRDAGPELVEDIRARIRALSLAHSASQGNHGDTTVQLSAVVVNTMEPYADEEGERVRVAGPDVELPIRMVTPIGLIVHELATNAVKYGALSQERGTVNIRWDIGRGALSARDLTLVWTESGGPELSYTADGPARAGFGSQMTVLAAGQVGGLIEREWPPGGAIARLRFPLP